MGHGSIALALGAGLVAAVNPCGFALLPAYLSLLVLDEGQSRSAAVARALKATVAMTAGFAAVFGIFGLVVSPVAATVQLYLPGFTVAFGLLLAAAGGWVAVGRRVSVPSFRRRRQGPPLTSSLGSMTGFGASYALASLGCTVAPFLAVVVTAFRSGNVGDGLVLFLAYAGGMGAVVGASAVAVALARNGLLGALRRWGGVVPRLGGLVLVVAGLYVAWYGAWELRVLHSDAVGDDPVVDTGGHLQHWLADHVAALGAGGFVAVLAALVALGLLPGRSASARIAAADRWREGEQEA